MPTPEQIIEALLLASDKPLTVERIVSVLGGGPVNTDEAEVVTNNANAAGGDILLNTNKQSVRDILSTIQLRYQGGVLELNEVASGFRFQISSVYGPWVGLLHEEKPQKYSRALLETLVIIAYRQPVTRGDIEDIRGVAVSSNIMKALQEREWVRVVGYRDVPGKPGLYATTKQFLDYFNLTSLEQLPPLAEVRDLAEVAQSLDLGQSLNSAQSLDEEPEKNKKLPEDRELLKDKEQLQDNSAYGAELDLGDDTASTVADTVDQSQQESDTTIH